MHFFTINKGYKCVSGITFVIKGQLTSKIIYGHKKITKCIKTDANRVPIIFSKRKNNYNVTSVKSIV